jgi:hypothetical protein
VEKTAKSGLAPRHTPGASVIRIANGWRMEIPASSTRREYCLAQVDDYSGLSRDSSLHSPPWSISLHARISREGLPGTWGFGLWNDPFGLSLGFGGRAGRLPALPNTVWFFYASPPNWISLHDSIPGQGFFAGVSQSPRISSIFLAPAVAALPLMTIRPISRLFRRWAGRLVRQDAALVSAGVMDWHKYTIQWLHDSCMFTVDDRTVLQCRLSPASPLGLVIWIDNQYATWDPQGRFGYGILENPAAWLEVAGIRLG